MEVIYASEPSPGARNEDFVLAGADFVFVLDGATTMVAETGCIHDVPWLVSQLGSRLGTGLATDREASLPDLLRNAIEGLVDAHADTCDLTNSDSPSSTVAILRSRGHHVDYLVLADSPIVLETTDGTVLPITDERTTRLPDYSREGIRRHRNQPDGFWVASTKPEASAQAITGSIEKVRLRRAALLTDGGARLAERYGLPWKDLLDILDYDGPRCLIERTRAAEARTREGQFRGKAHDDATAVLCRFNKLA